VPVEEWLGARRAGRWWTNSSGAGRGGLAEEERTERRRPAEERTGMGRPAKEQAGGGLIGDGRRRRVHGGSAS
jgi:hypothetical protein